MLKGDVGKEHTAFAATCRMARLCNGSADIDWCNRRSATRLKSAQFVTCSQIPTNVLKTYNGGFGTLYRFQCINKKFAL